MTYASGSWQELQVSNMNEQHQNAKTRVFVPWLVSLIIVIILIVLGLVYRKATISTFDSIARRNEILSTMRINLLKAIEAEKSAILAETEEASHSFADQARAATDSVEKGRREIEPILKEERIAKEMRLMEEFDACWIEFNDSTRCCSLAVQDTNVKATRLSYQSGRSFKAF
jgi:flagellar biogenesis protein FliO